MAERRTPTKQRRRVPAAPADAERVSLHGPAFEAALKGLLAVDPKDLDDAGADHDDGS